MQDGNLRRALTATAHVQIGRCILFFYSKNIVLMMKTIFKLVLNVFNLSFFINEKYISIVRLVEEARQASGNRHFQAQGKRVHWGDRLEYLGHFHHHS